MPIQRTRIKGSLRTEVVIADAPGSGNANHWYLIIDNETEDIKGDICFQNGPIKEVGVNGITHEDLLAIVAHRLECFQSSEFSCRENALALTKIQEALHWLNHRTTNRQRRGVEGTHTK